MAKIGDLVSSLKIGHKRFNNIEWWATRHKLKKQVKLNELCKANAAFNCSYKVNTVDSFTSVSDVIASMDRHSLSSDSDLAPWNPMLRPFKQLIVFKKNK